jgi:hypothetical protein
MDRSRREDTLEYQHTLHRLDANRPTLVQEAHCISTKDRQAFEQMKRQRKLPEKSL